MNQTLWTSSLIAPAITGAVVLSVAIAALIRRAARRAAERERYDADARRCSRERAAQRAFTSQVA